MGLWGKVKQFFNIGGLLVEISEFESPFPRDDSVLKGTLRLTAKGGAIVKGTVVKFVMEETSGRGGERETEETVLGEDDSQYTSYLDFSFPLTLAADETREVPFCICGIDIEERLQDRGGVLGAIGKLGAFVNKERVEFFLEAEVDVEGTFFDPSHKVAVEVVAGSSATA